MNFIEFPNIIPSSMDFTPPRFAVNSDMSLGGVTSRRKFGNRQYDGRLVLEFRNQPNYMCAQVLLSHVLSKGLAPISFQDGFFSGAGNQLLLFLNCSAYPGLLWYFIEDSPPRINRVEGGAKLSNMSLELAARLVPNAVGASTIAILPPLDINGIGINDVTRPTVAISDNVNGIVKIDQAVTFAFQFSENIFGFSSANIAVSNGTKNNFSAISGSSYTLTVTPPVLSSGNITVNISGDNITDIACNKVILPPEYKKAFDTIPPTVSAISYGPNDGSLSIGEAITFVVNFSENVFVVGTPSIALNSGGSAIYTSGSGSNQFIFTYTPSAGQTATDLATVTSNALTGTIQDIAGNLVVATGFDNVNPVGTVIVDTIPPTVVITDNVSGTVKIGETVTFTFTFSEAVTGFTAGDINIGNGTKGTFTVVNSTIYTLVVTPAVSSSGNITVNIAAGAAADLAGNGNIAPSQYNKSFDTLEPTVASIVYGTNDGNLSIGETISLIVSFNKTVNVTGVPTIALNSGGVASYASGTNSNQLTFAYTPILGDSTSDLGTATTNALTGTIKDSTGNSANAASFDNINPIGTVVVDTGIPTITISDNISGTVKAGQTVTFTFTFSEAVTGFSANGVTVSNGSKGTFTASSTSVYTLIVTPTPSSSGNITVNVSAGAATDSAGNGNAAPSQYNKPFDTAPPIVDSISYGSNDGNLSTGESITLIVAFSEVVFVTGVPTIALNTGGTASYTSGNGSNQLIFTYTPLAGHSTSDLGTAASNAFSGNVADSAGNQVTASGFDNVNPVGIVTVNYDPYFSNRKLLLHMNGADSSTAFMDSSSNGVAVIPAGDAKISTTQSMFGGSSAYFDGTGDSADTAILSLFELTGDFTIECWIRPSVYSASNNVIFNVWRNSSNKFILATIGTAGNLYYLINGSVVIATNTAPALNTWSHVALVKSGTTTKIYLNGTSIGTTTAAPSAGWKKFELGTDRGASYYAGYMDEVRVSDRAEHTANFTPNGPFPEGLNANASSTKLLLHMDGSNGSTTFIDSSSSAIVITPTGGAALSTAQSKFGSASAYFNGVNDSLYFTDPDLGTGKNFTIECWIKTGSTTQYAQIIGNEKASPYSGFTLMINHDSANDGRIALYIAGNYVCKTGAGFNDNNWHHVVLMLLSDPDETRGYYYTIYVDGVYRTHGFTFAGMTGDSNMYIAKNNLYPSRNFVGYIDESRLSGRNEYISDYTDTTYIVPTGPLA